MHSTTARTLFTGLLALLAVGACSGPRPRSEWSFSEIHQLVQGKTAAQVLLLLGEPDSRQPLFDADERWIWWNYTFLDGSDYPPEMRGRVVHLEIVVRSPERVASQPDPYAAWEVDDALGVTYQVPSSDG